MCLKAKERHIGDEDLRILREMAAVHRDVPKSSNQTKSSTFRLTMSPMKGNTKHYF